MASTNKFFHKISTKSMPYLLMLSGEVVEGEMKLVVTPLQPFFENMPAPVLASAVEAVVYASAQLLKIRETPPHPLFGPDPRTDTEILISEAKFFLLEFWKELPHQEGGPQEVPPVVHLLTPEEAIRFPTNPQPSLLPRNARETKTLNKRLQFLEGVAKKKYLEFCETLRIPPVQLI